MRSSVKSVALSLAFLGAVAALPAAAEPISHTLNRLYSACQTGSDSACTAYNRLVFERHHQAKAGSQMEPATLRVFDPFGGSDRQPTLPAENEDTTIIQVAQ